MGINLKNILMRGGAIATSVGGVTGLLIILYVLVDLRGFEYPYLWEMLGYKGVAVFVACVVVVTWLTLGVFLLGIKGRFPGLDAKGSIGLILGLCLLAWVGQWLFMERPVSVMVAEAMLSDSDRTAAFEKILAGTDHGLSPNIIANAEIDPSAARVMMKRIAVGRPEFYQGKNVGEVIRTAADEADVPPQLLFYWLYLTSFYGEATSGPLPFTRQMTGETFRDLVQVHLPSWFMESELRAWLIRGTFFETLVGEGLGWKLRYALQKANLDVSMDPYNANIYTDVYLVLSRFEHLFPDLFQEPTDDPLVVALRKAFQRLNNDLGLDACDTDKIVDPAKYKAFRDDLITFARAVYYKSYFDFEFATRVQSLVARNSFNRFEASIGSELWGQVSLGQRSGLASMARDVFKPNVGKPSPIPYLLPEFNCAPVDYLTTEAGKAGRMVLGGDDFWYPPNPEYLWAGGGFLLKLLSEVWGATAGEPIPGIQATNTVEQAIGVIALVED